jgi:hypothetical protein
MVSDWSAEPISGKNAQFCESLTYGRQYRRAPDIVPIVTECEHFLLKYTSTCMYVAEILRACTLLTLRDSPSFNLLLFVNKKETASISSVKISRNSTYALALSQFSFF